MDVLHNKYNVKVQSTTSNNRICEILGVKYPIIQAPMYWLTHADLIAAVSNAGGLGCLGPFCGMVKEPQNGDESYALQV